MEDAALKMLKRFENCLKIGLRTFGMLLGRSKALEWKDSGLHSIKWKCWTMKWVFTGESEN